jgi:hypothetical protein
MNKIQVNGSVGNSEKYNGIIGLKQSGETFARVSTRAKENGQARKPEAEADGYDGLVPPLGLLRDTGEEIKAPPYLVKHTIPDDAVGLIVGQSGMAKTGIAMHLGVACAAFGDYTNEDGTPLAFFGRRIKRKIGVLFVAFEGGKLPLKCRMRAAKKQHGIEEEIPFVLCLPEGIGITNLSLPEDRKTFAAYCKKVDKWMQRTFGVKLEMVIVDTLQAAYAIEKIESNSEIAALSKDFKTMVRETGCGVGILIHHAGKDASKGALGASNFRAFFDFVLMASGDRDDVAGVTSNRKLAQAKHRDDEEGPIAAYEVENMILDKDEDGEDFGALVIVPNMAAKATATKQAKAKPKGQKAEFFKAIRCAVNECGEPLPGVGKQPFNTKGVTRDTLKRYATEHGILNGCRSEDAKRSKFSNLILALAGDDHIGQDKIWVWLL